MKLNDRIITDLCIPEALSALLLPSGRRPLFFDIETTGLQPAGCYVYLIGCLTETAEGLRFRQWFAENADEEPALLSGFCEAVSPDTVLVHYNGNTFDIPFLNARIRHHKLPLTLPEKEDTVDLYRSLTPCKKLFSLEDRRQPTLEKKAGYHRTDTFSGGTLIPYYTEYVGRCRFDSERAGELLEILLLHNSDDILGLSQLPFLLPYCMLTELPFTEMAQEERNGIYTVSATLPYSLPGPFRRVTPLPEIPEECRNTLPVPDSSGMTDDGSQGVPPDSEGFYADLSLTGNKLKLSVPVYQMAPFYFFPNYKEYYYLPAEGKAIHKSLASFVEKPYRKPATRETARQSKSGSFLPQITEHIGPVFRLHYGDSLCFFEKRELDPAALSDYIRCWYRFLTEM